jgi:hypothetical protein
MAEPNTRFIILALALLFLGRKRACTFNKFIVLHRYTKRSRGDN